MRVVIGVSLTWSVGPTSTGLRLGLYEEGALKRKCLRKKKSRWKSNQLPAHSELLISRRYLTTSTISVKFSALMGNIYQAIAMRLLSAKKPSIECKHS